MNKCFGEEMQFIIRNTKSIENELLTIYIFLRIYLYK